MKTIYQDGDLRLGQDCLSFGERSYQLSDYPYEPYLSIRDEKGFTVIIHNSFTLEDLYRTAKENGSLRMITGNEYDMRGICALVRKALALSKESVDIGYLEGLCFIDFLDKNGAVSRETAIDPSSYGIKNPKVMNPFLHSKKVCRTVEGKFYLAQKEEKITVEEIPIGKIGEFWELHIKYLVEDGIISDAEDVEYFTGEEYRGILEDHMVRTADRQHMVYFRRGGKRIGTASYCTYQSEDGKCFILDFWVFPAFRGNGTGHRCFKALEQYTKKDGAKYYELNSTKENSIRFWKSLGFTENRKDEYDMLLLVKR